jgi:hypothetical protein
LQLLLRNLQYLMWFNLQLYLYHLDLQLYPQLHHHESGAVVP